MTSQYGTVLSQTRINALASKPSRPRLATFQTKPLQLPTLLPLISITLMVPTRGHIQTAAHIKPISHRGVRIGQHGAKRRAQRNRGFRVRERINHKEHDIRADRGLRRGRDGRIHTVRIGVAAVRGGAETGVGNGYVVQAFGGVAALGEIDCVWLPVRDGADGAGVEGLWVEDDLLVGLGEGVLVVGALGYSGCEGVAVEEVGGFCRGGAVDAVGGDALTPSVVARLEDGFGERGCGKGEGEGGEGNGDEERVYEWHFSDDENF